MAMVSLFLKTRPLDSLRYRKSLVHACDFLVGNSLYKNFVKINHRTLIVETCSTCSIFSLHGSAWAIFCSAVFCCAVFFFGNCPNPHSLKTIMIRRLFWDSNRKSVLAIMTCKSDTTPCNKNKFVFYLQMSQLCKSLVCLSVWKLAQAKHSPTVFNSNRRYEKIAIGVRVLQNT